MGQAAWWGAGDGNQEMEKSLGISLERARSAASNAAATSARYHDLAGSNCLEDNYEVEATTVLGSGLCGDVVLAKGRIDGRRYALKTISKKDIPTTMAHQLSVEVEIYLGLDHPNIARLRDVYVSDMQVHLLSECCSGGELYGALQRCGRFQEADASDAARQMLRAVAYLHSSGIVHRDLKLENFLYESTAKGAPLKLIDFGLAKAWDPAVSAPMTEACGSSMYVAPEVLRKRGYTNKCDIWSLGVIVFMLLSGYPPFHGSDRSLHAAIIAGEADWSHKSRWRNVSEAAVEFVRLLFTKQPDRRPSASRAFRHSWLAGGKAAAAAPAAQLSPSMLQSLQRYAGASKLRRASLQLLAQELAPEQARELRELFLSMDRSRRGTLCPSDLKEAMRGCEAAPVVCPIAEPEADPILGIAAVATPCRAHARTNLADAMMSKVTPAPLARCTTPRSPTRSLSTPPSPPKSPVYTRTPWLIRRACCRPPPPASPPMSPAASWRMSSTDSPPSAVAQLFMAMSPNGGRLHYLDFAAAGLEAVGALCEEVVWAAFCRLDADRSGAISAEDLRAVLGEPFEGATAEELLQEAAPCKELSYEEFLHLIEDRGAAQPATGLSITPAEKLYGRCEGGIAAPAVVAPAAAATTASVATPVAVAAPFGGTEIKAEAEDHAGQALRAAAVAKEEVNEFKAEVYISSCTSGAAPESSPALIYAVTAPELLFAEGLDNAKAPLLLGGEEGRPKMSENLRTGDALQRPRLRLAVVPSPLRRR
mmetsp:Transcript_81466/g.174474  ORF Transcript_81466/g.174474 Transcript_81466/m.174474 type:complete len:763 (-) Transcript_81466:99-2387(-)